MHTGRVYFSTANAGGSIIVWGAFSESGKPALAITNGKEDATKYIKTLEKHLLPFAAENHPIWTFQKDSTSIHTANLAKMV